MLGRIPPNEGRVVWKEVPQQDLAESDLQCSPQLFVDLHWWVLQKIYLEAIRRGGLLRQLREEMLFFTECFFQCLSQVEFWWKTWHGYFPMICWIDHAKDG